MEINNYHIHNWKRVQLRGGTPLRGSPWNCIVIIIFRLSMITGANIYIITCKKCLDTLDSKMRTTTVLMAH